MPDYTQMQTDDLKDLHEELLRLQEQEVEQGKEDVALEIANRRMRIWNELTSRGVEL